MDWTFWLFQLANFVLSISLTSYWMNKKIRGYRLLARANMLVLGITFIWIAIR